MAGSVTLEVVTVDKPADMNVIIGQAHFIKTVEDLHEALGVSPRLRFGLAFWKASARHRAFGRRRRPAPPAPRHRLQALKELPRRPTLVLVIRAVGSWPSGTPAG
jgi:Adenosine specific kinase